MAVDIPVTDATLNVDIDLVQLIVSGTFTERYQYLLEIGG